MGIVKGLKGIQSHLDAEEAKFAKRNEDTGPKTEWFKLKDKESAKVIFLQELDPESPNYSTKNDLGFIATEHQSPDNYRIHALCTSDEGECYGCEEHRKDYKAGWKTKTKLYINVLVDNGVDEPFVAVLSQGNGPKSVTPNLIEQATEIGTITDKYFKIKRTGSGISDTSYLLTPLGAHKEDVESFELFDLEKVVRQIPYEEQSEFYHRGSEESNVQDTPRDSAPATTSSVDSEW